MRFRVKDIGLVFKATNAYGDDNSYRDYFEVIYTDHDESGERYWLAVRLIDPLSEDELSDHAQVWAFRKSGKSYVTHNGIPAFCRVRH